MAGEVAIQREENTHRSLGVVVALTDDRRLRARLSEALRSDAQLVTAGSLRPFLDCLRTALCPIGVIDAAFADCAPIGAVASAREAFPSLPLLAYCDISSAAPGLLVQLVQAGVTGLLLQPLCESPHAIRANLAAAVKNGGAQRVYAGIGPFIPASLRSLLRYGLSHAHEEALVENAARSLGENRKTLRNRLDAIGAPPPREFLGWIQLSVGAFLLDDPGRTSEQVAHMLGFSSGMAFRNMLQRYCGLTTGKLRAVGGGEFVLELFRLRLTSGRQAENKERAAPLEVRRAEPRREQSA